MVSILEAKNLIMTPKQNKPKWDYDRSWEENLIVKFDLSFEDVTTEGKWQTTQLLYDIEKEKNTEAKNT
jgi:hypothetical protein